MTEPVRRLAFGPFEADLKTGELFRNGMRRRLPGQPFEILALLLSRPGDLVTREELRQRLWPDDTFVDFDHGLNAAVGKLREALGDSAEKPRYVETIPRRGYRMIVPVEARAAAPLPAPAASAAAPVATPEPKPAPSAPPAAAPAPERSRRGPVVAILVVLGLVEAALLVGSRLRGADPQTVRALAVLPFEDLSGKADGSDEPYLADGITEAILQRLATIGSLRVSSRTSVQAYHGRHAPLAEIASALHVDAVVEGTVQRAAGRLRVSAKLVTTADDRTLWAETYERDLADVLSIQADIARAVADGIHARLTPEEKGRVAWTRRVDPEAYRQYLIGRFHLQKAVAAANDKAAAAFTASIARDPAFAAAYVGLAECEVFRLPQVDAQARAKAAATKALELAPRYADAHAARGLVAIYGEHDWTGAESSFRKALALDPRSFEAHYRFSLLLAILGRFDEAIEEGRRATDLDPLSPNAAADLARLYHFAGRNEEALRETERAMGLDPGYPWTYVFRTKIFEETGRLDDAYAAREKWAQLAGVDAAEIVSFRETYRNGGYRAFLERAAGAERERRERQRTKLLTAGLSHLYAALGRRAEALDLLDQSFENNSRDLIYLAVDPGYDTLRGEPRFVEMLRRLHLPENVRAPRATARWAEVAGRGAG